MGKSLVIVESPAKARTLGRILDKSYTIMASYGHVRDLPAKQGSVDVENDFEPKYEVLPRSKAHLTKIKAKIPSCETLYLATDLDREGEAIAWHLVQALGLNGGAAKGGNGSKSKRPAKSRKQPPIDIKRIVFHEITRDAILEAMQHPRDIAYDLVEAQKARRILDYLVGFNLSPFLWKKVRYGLSAGRVQSVALRLICEREREIDAFKSQEYWSIAAELSAEKDKAAPFTARLTTLAGKKLDKFAIGNEEQAQRIVAQFGDANYRVHAVTPKTSRRNPAPPFITSTLQQEASRKLGFSAKKTMTLAQRLYEGKDVGGDAGGLITYMRTDSVHLADVALRESQQVIGRLYGPEFGIKQPRHFRRKVKNAQEAHEAIRPTSLSRLPEELKNYLEADEFKLYDLIWKRTIACQMAQAVIDSVSVDIAVSRAGAKDGGEPTGNKNAKPDTVFRATGSTVRFAGFMRVYTEGADDQQDEQRQALPPLEAGQTLALLQLTPEQHFTEPPPRFSEASLVKALEEFGIGRPSTYAPIMDILQQRGYAKLEKKRFFPQDIGLVVNDLLVEHFQQYVDYNFTAQMEDTLDVIARGEAQWRPAVREFWGPFISRIHEKDAEVKRSDVTEESTEEECPECGKPMVIKLGRYGKFLACTGYPECRKTRQLGKDGEVDSRPQNEPTDEVCDACGAQMVIKHGRYGRFLSCSRYPECKTVRSISTGVDCPESGCDGYLCEKRSKRGKIFYSCSRYPKCKFSLGNKPVAEQCPTCDNAYVVEKWSKKDGARLVCSQEDCDFSTAVETAAATTDPS